MIRSIVEWSVRVRFLALGTAAAFLAVGFTQLGNVPVDVLPEFSPPYVEVQTEALGLSADEVEQLITVPLEADLLQGVAWLEEIHSESVPGLSSIVLLFEPGTDVIRARQMVAERLTHAHVLPHVSRPPVMLQPLSSSSRVMMVGLRSSDVSLIDMSVQARWTIRPRLLGVPGVANVSIFGLRERQLQVLVDPERLNAHGLKLEQIIDTAGNSLWASPLTFLRAATPGTGGFIDTPNQRLGIQHRQPISAPEDMAMLPISGAPGVVLGDVATVVQEHQPLIGDAVVQDGPGLVLVIEKFPDANTLATTKAVEEALAALKPGMGGIEVDSTLYRPASFIESAISGTSIALLIGLLLAALILAAALGWRVGIVALVTIPLSLAAGGLAVYLLGGTLNGVTVAGLVVAIAVVIADASVIGDHVARHLRASAPPDLSTAPGAPVSPTSVVGDAAGSGLAGVVYATLIIALITLPIAFMSGAASAFLPHLATAYLAAVGASLLVALTVGPALMALLLMRGGPTRSRRDLGERVGARYERLLQRVLPRSKVALGASLLATIVVALVAVPLVPKLGDSLVPSFNELDLLVRWEAAPGTSREEMSRILSRAGAELRALPGVANVGGYVGRAITSDRVVNTNSADLWVSIDPDADYHATVATIEDVTAGYPGLSSSVTTYTSDRIGSLLAEDETDVAVRIYGAEHAVLRAKAEEVRLALANVSGLADPTVIDSADQPTLEVQVDLEAAARHGLKPGDIRRATTSLFSGIEVGFLFEDQKVFEVVVWGTPELRANPTSLGQVRIDTPSGEAIPLSDVASIRVASSAAVVRREGVQRIIDITARITGGDNASIQRGVDAALAGISFPLDYHPDARYPAFERQGAILRLLAAILGAAIVAFLILQASVERWRLAALTFVALPGALVGGVAVAVVAERGVLSIGALAALLVVLGLTVRHGLALLLHCQDLERRNGEGSRASLVMRAALDRLRPTVASAVATAGAVLPFALLGEGPGMELLRPMALVLIGGLATSTLVTLFVLPAVLFGAGTSMTEAPNSQPFDQVALSPA